MVGLLSIVCGILITNLLSYVGLFLLAVTGIQALREFMVSRRLNVTVSLLISIGVSLAVASVLFSMYGYDHIQGFFTASAVENPDGFRGWHEPFTYLATRVEGISEIALFLSFGFLAILFHPKKLRISYSDWRDVAIGTLLSGLITLLAIFVSGAFRTGETARTAIFIYPYVILALRNADSVMLKDILILAGLQTVAMQLLGGYFW